MMNALLFGLSLASAASAQMAVAVNGFNMVSYAGGAPSYAPQATPYSPPAGGYQPAPVPYAPPPASSATASTSNMYGYNAPPAQSNMASSSAPPSYYTPPPAPPAQYTTMPYSSFMYGGYSSMDCGYGFTKAADGSCQQQQWVSLIIFHIDCEVLRFVPSTLPRVAINRLRKYMTVF